MGDAAASLDLDEKHEESLLPPRFVDLLDPNADYAFAEFDLVQTDAEDTAFVDAFQASVMLEEMRVEISPAQLPCVVKALHGDGAPNLLTLDVVIRQAPGVSPDAALLANIVDSVSRRQALKHLHFRIAEERLAHEAAADPSPESSPVDLSAAFEIFLRQPDRMLDFNFLLDPATASSLARALEQATEPLRILGLSVDFSTHNDLFTALQKAPIQHLYLGVRKTKEGSGARNHLTAIVSNNPAMIGLRLSGGVDDSHVAEIARGLRQNSTLEQLWIRNSAVTDKGATTIADALRYNKTLLDLDMIGCSVINLGTEWLATEQLEFIRLGESVRWPPPSLGREGTYAFLRELQKDSPILSVQRVNLVGDGGVGKTTFGTALLMRKARSSKPLDDLREIIRKRVLRWGDGHVKMWMQELAERSTMDLGLAKEFADGLKLGGFDGEELLSLGSTVEVYDRLSGGSSLGKKVAKRVCAVLLFIDPNFKGKNGSTGPGGHAVVDYSALTSLPHVWTEGAVPDSWGDHAIWDFPGQMQYYPAHHVFLGCETAVYAVVVDGSAGKPEACIKNASHWLGLIRCGENRTASAVSARIVVTHRPGLQRLAPNVDMVRRLRLAPPPHVLDWQIEFVGGIEP